MIFIVLAAPVIVMLLGLSGTICGPLLAFKSEGVDRIKGVLYLIVGCAMLWIGYTTLIYLWDRFPV